jgi:hypothetical protein
LLPFFAILFGDSVTQDGAHGSIGIDDINGETNFLADSLINF